MLTKTKKNMAPLNIVRQLLIQAEADAKRDRRTEPRYPFFRSVSIQMDGRSYSAFTREISTSSIGLLHNVELPLCEVEIVISTEAAQKDSLRVRIDRCESCGDGWYISGGEILPRGAQRN